jgi:putative ABC transport system permease protein
MQTIPLVNLLYLVLPLIIVFIFYYKYTQESKDIPYATVRMVLQLILIGYLLIYIFENKNPYIGLAILLFMGLVSAKITLRNTQDNSLNHYGIIFISILISTFIHLALIVVFVLDLHEYYEPRYVIPIAGMIFANTMNALSLCVERFEKEKSRESYTVSRKIAFKAAMIPQINALLAVGLVALPGMMTGQILSGIDPLIAVRYQIMIMSMTLSTAGISIIIYFYFKERF